MAGIFEKSQKPNPNLPNNNNLIAGQKLQPIISIQAILCVCVVCRAARSCVHVVYMSKKKVKVRYFFSFNFFHVIVFPGKEKERKKVVAARHTDLYIRNSVRER